MSVDDLFADAQKSTHNHKSLAKRLRKLEVKYINNGHSDEFEAHVKDCVVRLFEVTKSETAGARVVKFLSTYFGTSISDAKTEGRKRQTKQQSSRNRRRDTQEDSDEDMSGLGDGIEEQVEAEDDEEQDEDQDAVANAILVSLIPYLSAKDKTMRYRATQIVSSILSSLNSIDDSLYTTLRHELVKRLKDRVPAIRLEAVLVLGPLVESEMELAGQRGDEAVDSEDSDYNEESVQASGLLEKLLDVLCNDTNADVRRALLVNLPISSETLPYLLERARDKDAATRRAFYLKLCLTKLGDFRHLSVSMREKLLRWGLRDRDEKVRKAAARMFREKWIEDCAKSQPQKTTDGEDQQPAKPKHGLHAPSIPALLELLERIDVINSGAEEGIASEAMKEFWAGRPDYVEEPTFDDDFWQNVSPEAAFMARSWNDYCQSNTECYELIENRMPEVTRFGFLLQYQINELTTKIEANKQLNGSGEEETTDQEFVVEQMLHIAHTLDYTDEIGRRKMFGLFRNAITMPDFPDECTKLAVEALRLTCTPDAAGEREFTSVILEAISEVHDTISSSDHEGDEEGADEATEAPPTGEEDSFVSARSEVSQKGAASTNSSSSSRKNLKLKAALTEEESETLQLRTILIQLKCLNIAHAMLQNVSGHITSNIHMENMLESLVLPCVRSHDTPVREKGLECLGLCCLLEPSMAVENWNVFVHCLKKGDDNIKVLCVQLLCDMLLSSSSSSFKNNDNNTEKILEFDMTPFTTAFGFTNPEVQLTATTSLGKFMLCGFYSNNEESFDDAVEQAELRGVKGWEILMKVRIAVQPTTVGTDKGGDGVDTAVGIEGRGGKGGMKTPMRRSTATVTATSD